MKKQKILVRGGAAPEGTKWIAAKYGLTLTEAAALATHPRRDQIMVEHDRWCLSIGAAPSSALSRGRLLDGLRDGTLDNPLPLILGVSAGWWAAGAAVAAVVGYFVFRKTDVPALAPKQVSGIPLVGVATPADYIKGTTAAVGGYGSAYEKKSWASRRTSEIPAQVRDVWFAQEREFAKRKAVLNAIRQGAPIPTSAELDKSALTNGQDVKGARNFSPPEKGYSKQMFLVFRPQNHAAAHPSGVACGGPLQNDDCEAVWGWNPTDEWGDAYEGWGVSSDPLNTVLLVTTTVLPYIPGVGSAASATFAGLVALGQGKSLDEAAFAAVRAGLPPGAQLAFDLGVGIVLEKKSVDQAVTDAALNQLEKKYPGSKAAYNQGKALAKQQGLGRVQWSPS